MSIRVALLTVTVVSLFGCGGGGPSAPVLSEITMAERSVAVGDSLFATVQVTDIDGDFDQGKMVISVESEDGDTSLESVEPVVEVAPETISASLTVGLKIFGSELSIGRYALSLVLIDNADFESEPAVDHFELTRR